jgi:Zn-dependent protease with chaperone function
MTTARPDIDRGSVAATFIGTVVTMLGKTLKWIVTIAAAVVIGFGVPAGWVWIGSQLQGGSGASSVSFTAAVVVLMGIIATYAVLMIAAGWVQALLGDEREAKRPVREPWMRSMRDTPQRAGQQQLRPLEQVFVVTTLIVTAAFWVWFALFAGSPLPN